MNWIKLWNSAIKKQNVKGKKWKKNLTNILLNDKNKKNINLKNLLK
jgi:hypothetical protein